MTQITYYRNEHILVTVSIHLHNYDVCLFHNVTNPVLIPVITLGIDNANFNCLS